jgi:hypothetical protein
VKHHDETGTPSGGSPMPCHLEVAGALRAAFKKRFRVRAHTLATASTLDYDEGDRPSCSMGGSILYGPSRRPESYIEDVEGFIDIETPPVSETLPAALILQIAEEIATEESPNSITVTEWHIIRRSESILRFKVKAWEETEMGFRLNGGERDRDE